MRRARIYKNGNWWWWECQDSAGGLTVYGGRDTWQHALDSALEELKTHYQWKSKQDLNNYRDGRS